MTSDPQEPWHVHDGGGRPNKGSDYVEVVFRDGRHESAHSALFPWPWRLHPKGDDIVRWRYAEAPPTPWAALKQAAEWFDEYSHCLLGDDWKVAQERATYCRRAAGERV